MLAYLVVSSYPRSHIASYLHSYNISGIHSRSQIKNS